MKNKKQVEQEKIETFFDNYYPRYRKDKQRKYINNLIYEFYFPFEKCFIEIEILFFDHSFKINIYFDNQTEVKFFSYDNYFSELKDFLNDWID